MFIAGRFVMGVNSGTCAVYVCLHVYMYIVYVYIYIVPSPEGVEFVFRTLRCVVKSWLTIKELNPPFQFSRLGTRVS